MNCKHDKGIEWLGEARDWNGETIQGLPQHLNKKNWPTCPFCKPSVKDEAP